MWDDPSHAVHMSGHDVPAKAAVRRHGPFQVHRTAYGQLGQGGAVQRLVHDIGGEAGRRGAAVTVRQTPLTAMLSPSLVSFQDGLCLDGQDGGVLSPCDVLDGAQFLNNAREHGKPPRFRSRNLRPVG